MVIRVPFTYALGLVSLTGAPSYQPFLDAPNLSGHRRKVVLAFQCMGRYFHQASAPCRVWGEVPKCERPETFTTYSH